jgi:hypothetical protein
VSGLQAAKVFTSWLYRDSGGTHDVPRVVVRGRGENVLLSRPEAVHWLREYFFLLASSRFDDPNDDERSSGATIAIEFGKPSPGNYTKVQSREPT